jgi:hypothetical protein
MRILYFQGYGAELAIDLSVGVGEIGGQQNKKQAQCGDTAVGCRTVN